MKFVCKGNLIVVDVLLLLMDFFKFCFWKIKKVRNLESEEEEGIVLCC